MEKRLESIAKIRFQDCDPFNHLNNSKYIDYFINAREDQILKHYNLDIFKHIQTIGKGWLIASNQIAYVKPAMMMEEVIIESKLIKYSNSSLQVEMKMWNIDKTVLKSIYWTTFVYFEVQSQKKAEHSQELNKLFSEIIIPVEEVSFEKRSREIIQKFKTTNK